MATPPNYHCLLNEVLSSIPLTTQSITNSYVTEQLNLETCPIVTVTSNEEAASIRSQVQPSTASRPIAQVLEQANSIFSYRLFNHHPRFFGFLPGPSHPVTLLSDLLLSSKNPHAGSWSQSSGPSAIETGLIRWLAEAAGLAEETAGGLFVSGGSMANLVGLQVARDQVSREEWEQRVKGIIYVSEQTRSSITKGLRILGFNNKQVRKVRCDEEFSMSVPNLVIMIKGDREKGLTPFLIVASCGTTNTGSLHIDGAYSASILLSKSHKHPHGISHADSISWDTRKWLFQTYGCGMVLLRNHSRLLQSFATGAEHTRDAADFGDFDTPNFWNFGSELTRLARGMRSWFSLQVLGLDCVWGGLIMGLSWGRRLRRS
ncbi:related to glutamic acid decarboxylase [Phialocephala subalpina]|uniref:Related to glutamic acid decarboxylase n=1 Tax=Phialocephala subalpina TaxID=576137 RepID=A0A1L7WMG2_9HELO|nr:related to glutamic acid decarboxylase [Phialocephala subalpina]